MKEFVASNGLTVRYAPEGGLYIDNVYLNINHLRAFAEFTNAAAFALREDKQ